MKFVVRIVVSLYILFAVSILSAQNAENIIVSSDSEFVMKVVREKGEIILTVDFLDTIPFDYMTIERKTFGDTQFSQCKYIDYKDVLIANLKIKRKDTYPYPAASDVLYRLKITTKEGIIRIFPPIRLAALQSTNTKSP